MEHWEKNIARTVKESLYMQRPREEKEQAEEEATGMAKAKPTERGGYWEL